jgi:Tfp pilus assembly protein PilO
MTPTETGDRRANWKTNLLERLHDPLQLRICVIAVVLAVGYSAVYQPMSNKIDETTRKLSRDKKLLDLADVLEQLQRQHHVFEDRVPQTDAKEWVQYVLEGIRRFPLKMAKFDSRPSRQFGPYRVIVLQIDLEGSFFDLDRFLRWLESDRRLLRADEVTIAPTRNREILVMHVSILGMTS